MLLERDAELGVLERQVAQLDSDGGKVVLIRGEAGIGKSALVREFADFHSETVRVLSGACDDLFIPQPLGPFWDIARLEPSLRGPLGDGDRPRLLDAVLDLLSRRPRSSLLIIEDTHWADEATLDAILYIGRRIATTNGLLLLTYRDGEVDYDHPLRGVFGDIPTQSVARIQLGGLSLAAVATMIGDSSLESSEVLAATRGNPLLVKEMASVAEEGDAASLHDSVMARVRKLSTGSREMLRALAVIPEPIPRADALKLPAADEGRLEECEQRGLLESRAVTIAFRHELIRRTVESALTVTERLSNNRSVLERLDEDTHLSLLVHCAAEAEDVDRLLDLAPRSARYAAATGSHIQAVEDFREVGPYLDRIGSDELGPLLDEWAREEFLVDDIPEAVRLNGLARDHYQRRGERGAESRALARAAQLHEYAGQRRLAEEFAREAIAVLGSDPGGAELAGALEVSTYLQVMAGNVAAVPGLVERTIEAGGTDIDSVVLIRSLNHRGVAANVASYPAGRASLDEARERAEAAGLWYEECRALVMHAWAAAEFRDLPIASDYSQRAIASAERHELPTLEGSAKAQYARVLELEGAWEEAADLARELSGAAVISQMVTLPVLGAIEARKGGTSARAMLAQAWEMASAADEFQRLSAAAIANAEYCWISGDMDVPAADLERVMATGLERGFGWSAGQLAAWLWRLGRLSGPPDGIAEPYRMLIEGTALQAATVWVDRGLPYERALALMHGGQADQLEALEAFETLGATTVAAKLRKSLRERGVATPRGKGRSTRRNTAGLTGRQAEVLLLIAEGLSNTQIADRLFLSPRTVESHVAAVFDKLDVTTRDEAVSAARAAGLLEAADRPRT